MLVLADHADHIAEERDEWKSALLRIHPTGRGTPEDMATDIMEGIEAAKNALRFHPASVPLDSACSRLAAYLESPPPYRKHCTREGLWLVLDAHGDSVLWSEQEIAVDAAIEALNHMAGVITGNATRPSVGKNGKATP